MTGLNAGANNGSSHDLPFHSVDPGAGSLYTALRTPYSVLRTSTYIFSIRHLSHNFHSVAAPSRATAVAGMAPEYLSSNVMNYLVYQYLTEAGTVSLRACPPILQNMG